jgi:hypothetical protein
VAVALPRPNLKEFHHAFPTLCCSAATGLVEGCELARRFSGVVPCLLSNSSRTCYGISAFVTRAFLIQTLFAISPHGCKPKSGRADGIFGRHSEVLKYQRAMGHQGGEQRTELDEYN